MCDLPEAKFDLVAHMARMKKALSIAFAAMMVAVRIVNDKRGMRLEPAN